MYWVLRSHRWRNLYSSARFLLSSFHSPSTAQPISSHPKILTLTSPVPLAYSLPIFPYSTTRSRRTPRSKRSKRAPPPVDQAQLDHAISELPARFTSADLAAALARHSDPRLCHHLLLAALRHPRFRRPNSAAAAVANDADDHISPFLITIKKLGAARLYREMDAVASLALSLPSLSLSEPFFNTIIYFYAEARMLSKAIFVYKRMRAVGDLAVRPTTRTYSLLFTALLGRGANTYIHHVYMDSIRALFRQMLDSGVAPDVLALNSLIKGYASSLHLNDALRVFHQMVPVYGVEPDENTYNYLIHGLCAQGRTRNARELWAEMRGKGLAPSGRAANSMVSALAMAGEVAEAAEVMWEVAGLGRALDGITYRTLLDEICRQGRVGDAVGLLRDMYVKELVDGRMYRDLLHGIHDEFGDSLDGGGN